MNLPFFGLSPRKRNWSRLGGTLGQRRRQGGALLGKKLRLAGGGPNRTGRSISLNKRGICCVRGRCHRLVSSDHLSRCDDRQCLGGQKAYGEHQRGSDDDAGLAMGRKRANSDRLLFAAPRDNFDVSFYEGGGRPQVVASDLVGARER